MKILCISGIPLIIVLAAAGCVAQPEAVLDEQSFGHELRPPEGAAPEPEWSDGSKGLPSNLASLTTETSLPARGGNGGGLTLHVTSPGVIYAVAVRADQFVNAVAFAFYQPRRVDNLYSNGDAYGTSVIFGGPGGFGGAWWYCPNGQGVVAVRGSSGTLVDRFGVICGDVTNPNPSHPLNTWSPLWGGTGGGSFLDMCPPGSLVDSFNVRASSLIDNLQPICIQAN